MANRCMAAKQERAVRQYREACAREGFKHFVQAVDRGQLGREAVPACDGVMVTRCERGEARGLAMDVGRCGKARASATRNTYGDNTRRSIDLMDCVARAPGWPIVSARGRK